jgi:hypothetical protein
MKIATMVPTDHDDDDADISGTVCSSDAVAPFKAPCIHGPRYSIATASDEQTDPEISASSLSAPWE